MCYSFRNNVRSEWYHTLYMKPIHFIRNKLKYQEGFYRIYFDNGHIILGHFFPRTPPERFCIDKIFLFYWQNILIDKTTLIVQISSKYIF